jgi:5-epi-alpha-selinene synthase
MPGVTTAAQALPADITFPHLECPFPSVINGWVHDVHDQTLAWVEHHELVAPDRLGRFEACQFAWLAARAYPTAPREELAIVANWNVWLFIHDDQNDEAGFGRNPGKLTELHRRMREILAGSAPRAGDSAFAHALRDLIDRMFERASETWRERFIRSIDEYFEACVWEANNRLKGLVPSVASYVDKRPLTGALNTDIELIELCEQIYLPSEVRAHPDVRRLTLMSNNVVCWSNDIISLKKEHRHGDVHNLVIAIKAECGLDWQGAVNLAGEWHNAEVRRFLELEAKLPSFEPDLDAELERYLRVLKAWMRGNLDWAYQTGRYGVATVPPSTYIKELRHEHQQPSGEGWR